MDPIPLATESSASAEPDYLGAFASSAGIPLEGDAPVKDLPVPGVESAPPAADPAAPPVATPDGKPSRPEAAARVEAKRRKDEEIETLRQKLADMEANYVPKTDYTSKVTELDTQLVEHRQLAEERAARIAEMEKSYKNDMTKDWEESIVELPEVQQATQKLNESYDAFFPKHISNPQEDEVDIRFSPKNLSQDKLIQVEKMVDHWGKAEYTPNVSPETRANAQHVAISNIAMSLGVKPSAFTEETINGQVFQVLRPSHPVYRHLSTQMPALVDNKLALWNARQQATENSRNSFLSVARQRQENTRKMYRDAGLVDGDELDQRLREKPDNQLLKVMQLLSKDPDLLKELKENIEHESVLNGHFTPKLNLAETEPGERTRTANAYMQRIGLRAINAPITAPLQKLVLKQAQQLSELQKKLDYYMTEDDRASAQNEPGLAAGSPTSKQEAPASKGAADDFLKRAADKYGLTLA